MQDKIFPQKIDGALGAMIIEDQPTHSIYLSSIAKYIKKVNRRSTSSSDQNHCRFVMNPVSAISLSRHTTSSSQTSVHIHGL